MKAAGSLNKPLAWFVGTEEGRYAATYPTYVIASDDHALEFTIALSEEQRWLWDAPAADLNSRRAYVTRLTRMRLHQPIFRSQVLRAYETRCTICRLKHRPLHDAAHILTDADGGEPVVTNYRNDAVSIPTVTCWPSGTRASPAWRHSDCYGPGSAAVSSCADSKSMTIPVRTPPASMRRCAVGASAGAKRRSWRGTSVPASMSAVSRSS
jgi:hypothetical protein